MSASATPAPGRVALLDVDLTLLATGGAGVRSIGRALGEVFGGSALAEGISFAGRTDPAIFAEIMARVPPETQDVAGAARRAQARYLEILEQELARAAGFRLCPGVPGVLDALAGRGALLGLCTGNLERGAWLKLSRGGLEGYFEFGGFGEDGPERVDVVRAALRRAERRLGEPLDPRSVWVIGDTPRDVAAAHGAGARALAVATGHTDLAALQATGAERVVADLAEPGWPSWIDELFPAI